MATKYVFLSLPLDAFDSSDKDEALSSLKAIVSDSGSAFPYNIPNFKIGTLDALVQQADDLGKMEGACAGVVSKVADSLRSLLGGDEDKIAQHKKVNDGPFPSLSPSPSTTLSPSPYTGACPRVDLTLSFE